MSINSQKNYTLQRSSTFTYTSPSHISPPYPPITTPPLSENTSFHPPNYNLHSIFHTFLSPRLSQLHQLTSLCLHKSISSNDTIFDNSSDNSPVHKVWQSTKICPPTPPAMKFLHILITSVNSIFNQPEIPLTVYSSCRIPPESINHLPIQKSWSLFSCCYRVKLFSLPLLL